LPLAAPVLQTTLDRRTPDRTGKVRDLARIAWNKQPPAPPLVGDLVANTRETYVEAFEHLTLRAVR
jgi:hypothetical protein